MEKNSPLKWYSTEPLVSKLRLKPPWLRSTVHLTGLAHYHWPQNSGIRYQRRKCCLSSRVDIVNLVSVQWLKTSYPRGVFKWQVPTVWAEPRLCLLLARTIMRLEKTYLQEKTTDLKTTRNLCKSKQWIYVYLIVHSYFVCYTIDIFV